MNKRSEGDGRKGKRTVFGLFFPQGYDFEGMLADQADRTVLGVRTFIDWLREGDLHEPIPLEKLEEDVDEMRYDLEEKLKDAFSTPFDRQDLYSLSRNIDYILNFATETAREMYAFEVRPDDAIMTMAESLLRGTAYLASGVRALMMDKGKVNEAIRGARTAAHEMDDVYITSLARAFRSEDFVEAMKKREVYHHLRDAGRALRMAKDALHRSVVGLS
jgi:uncharacterized protein Yka (UPF0111/DUF47 family)